MPYRIVMPRLWILAALVWTIQPAHSVPCSWVNIVNSWRTGFKAVVNIQPEETVDHWTVGIEFTESVTRLEAWTGTVTETADMNYTISNNCYNKMIYSCQCFQLPFLVRYQPFWSGSINIWFNGLLTTECSSNPCMVNVTSMHTCPNISCPTLFGSNGTNSSLPGYPKEYCENTNVTCWPNATEISQFKSNITGSQLSCLNLPRFITKEDSYNQSCFDYTGLHTDNCPNINPYTNGSYYKNMTCSCMTPYQFLTNRNYVKIEWKPAFIVTAETPDDISKAVKFANTHNLPVAVMSTGHDDQDRNAGPGPNSLLIRTTCFTDFTPSDSIKSANNILWYDGYAKVGAGLTFGPNYWGSLTNNDGLYDLAWGLNREIVGGTCNSVGIVGWTLGGGRGWTSPKYGLGVDQLLHVDMVDANGDQISANFNTNPDLFYAIRGGGGGFGVIYSMTIKLHNSTCGSINWTDCYTAKALYIEDKYSDTSRNIAETVIRKYMIWSLDYGKNKWNSVLTLKYNCTTANYTIWIGANCLEKTSDTTCNEFDLLISNINSIKEGSMHIETGSQTKSNYWTFWGHDTGEESVNRRWEQQLRSLVNSSASTNGFINTILDHWQPMCDQNSNSNCVLGYTIDGNLPALCGRNPSIPGCDMTYYNTSVYNSGGSIPTESRKASFIVWNFDVLNNNKALTLQEKEEWLHTTLAPEIYRFSSKSFFNEAEYTLPDGDWEARFWDTNVYANLKEIKRKYDPNYRFGCRHCVTP